MIPPETYPPRWYVLHAGAGLFLGIAELWSSEVPLGEIEVTGPRRSLNEKAVERLMESINEIGVRCPISIRTVPAMAGAPAQTVLITGLHRLEACRRLGLPTIPCVEHPDEDTARLWELDENWARAELTNEERREQIAERVNIIRRRQGLPDIPAPPRSAIVQVAKDLGISPDTVERAVAAESLAPEVKAEAKKAKIGTVERARISRARTLEEQLELVRAKLRPMPRPKKPPPPPTETAQAVIAFAEWLMSKCSGIEMELVLAWLGLMNCHGGVAAYVQMKRNDEG